MLLSAASSGFYDTGEDASLKSPEQVICYQLHGREALQYDPQETILLAHQRYMRQDKMVRVNKVTIKSGVSLG